MQVVVTSRLGRFTTRERSPDIDWIRPQSRSGLFVEERNVFPFRKSNADFSPVQVVT
jgi:hypothetical protein